MPSGRTAYDATSASLNETTTYGEAIHSLHERCGVYTRPAIVGTILDEVGWRVESDLSRTRLLEPAAGGGEFVVQAAERLVESLRRRGIEPGARDLNPRIVAFELYARASSAARCRVVRKLVSMRVHRSTAKSCAKAWIRTGDFLLSEKAPDEYTHIVGNPPYVRWSKVPARLRKAYEERLPSEMARGDLYLPFLNRAFDELKAEGMLGFVCSDRWLYAVYGRGFRRKWLSRLDVLSNRRVEAAEAFTRAVSGPCQRAGRIETYAPEGQWVPYRVCTSAWRKEFGRQGMCHPCRPGTGRDVGVRP